MGVLLESDEQRAMMNEEFNHGGTRSFKMMVFYSVKLCGGILELIRMGAMRNEQGEWKKEN